MPSATSATTTQTIAWSKPSRRVGWPVETLIQSRTGTALPLASRCGSNAARRAFSASKPKRAAIMAAPRPIGARDVSCRELPMLGRHVAHQVHEHLGAMRVVAEHVEARAG